MKKIVVLMSTYNGEKFLRQQIESILEQEGVCVELLVRDDGSTDNTIAILEEYQRNHVLRWYSGENLKSAWSFMDLIYNAPDCEYYALCDQDDVWLSDKLLTAISNICEVKESCPALYYGRPRIVDEDLEALPYPVNSLEIMTDFSSALINSNATGCTMVFNRRLLELVKKERPTYLFMHDGWIHKVCLCNHGYLIFDEDVHMLYRQHQKNVIGVTNSKWKRLTKHLLSFQNKECIRSRTIESLVSCYGEYMTKDELEKALLVANYRNSFIAKVKLLLSSDIKTAYLRRNILFKMAVLLGCF